MTPPRRSKNRRHQLHSAQRELAALVQEVRVRVVNCSASGCLVESNRPMPLGTIAALQLSFRGATFSDLVKVVRCDGLDRSAGLYHVATEFLSVTPAYAGSLRQLMRCDGEELPEWLTADERQSRTNVPCGADNQHNDACGQVGESLVKYRI